MDFREQIFGEEVLRMMFNSKDVIFTSLGRLRSTNAGLYLIVAKLIFPPSL
jgi:hypothetical protein